MPSEEPAQPETEKPVADFPHPDPDAELDGPPTVPVPESLCPEKFTGLKQSKPKTVAAGTSAVVHSLGHAIGVAGFRRGVRALSMLNQAGGIDCPSCAWPDPDGSRSYTEFCENGAKAVAWEADSRRLTSDFFARHSIDDLAKESDYWHGQQGRLTEPLVLRPGRREIAPDHRPVRRPSRSGGRDPSQDT